MADKKENAKDPLALVRSCTIDRDADMFFYSGPIYTEQVFSFISAVAERQLKTSATNVTVVLTTYGGDAHAAYQMARFLQRTYARIRFLVIGPCKSAGTLVVLGGDDLAFGPLGELGPLDVQLFKKDELVGFNSGLDTLQTFAMVTGYAFSTFENYMLQTIKNSGGTISTKTACEVASDLVTGLFKPLTAQIDPHKLSEVQRMMSVAKAYGQRIGRNLKEGALDDLINKYPSHSFIIDEGEAGELFQQVSEIADVELDLVALVEARLGCVWEPADDIVILDVRSLLGETQEEEKADETDGRDADGPGTDEGGEPGDNAAPELKAEATGPQGIVPASDLGRRSSSRRSTKEGPGR